MTNLRLTGEWKGVHDDRGDPGARHAFEKIIGGGGGKGAMQLAQRQSGEKANRVEMAGVIRDQNERAIVAEVFLSNDFEATIRSEQSANDQRDERTQTVD